MPQDLIGFWSHCRLTAPPFVHPDDDLPILGEKAPWSRETDPTDFKSYVSGPRFGDAEDHRLHLSLFPMPYAGDLRNAKVVILLLNPGFNHSDYWAEFERPEFRARLRTNLRQSFKGVIYPFLFLDPQFCWHPGFRWWERKLRDVIQRIAEVRHRGQYRPALEFLSKNLACVELIPYHSDSFRDHLLLKGLPSVKHARTFVHKNLVPAAVAGKRTVIVIRQKVGWEVTREYDNLIIYGKRERQGASLGRKSRGGKAILRRFGIEVK
jgi:hypothetical protein